MAPLPALLDTLATTLHPTRTLPHLLLPRQQTTTTTPAATTVTVVSTTSTSTNSDDSDPNAAKTLSGGAIAGIVIGSIAGFLLLVWIIRSCTNLGAPPGGDAVPGRPWTSTRRGTCGAVGIRIMSITSITAIIMDIIMGAVGAGRGG
ncbi:hypothetical protein NEMBOFW57_008989 [Staphylotrichum longicolle]|uniref:Uncharacterized protein n=1 Tax=Staphylotrichum longicolle TaxID=669026 RepID=A0AAD4ESB6_9PEZI|nr:hypothetical protein NEMBOFW57_008989 [Staphylotrichum longicolle]